MPVTTPISPWPTATTSSAWPPTATTNSWPPQTLTTQGTLLENHLSDLDIVIGHVIEDASKIKRLIEKINGFVPEKEAVPSQGQPKPGGFATLLKDKMDTLNNLLITQKELISNLEGFI